MKANAVIVVPIYKEQLTSCEKVSLCQLRCVLSQYDIVFVAPDGLQVSYGELGAGCRTVRFAKEYFLSKHTYSDLLLNPEFYRAFSTYEYMLLHQLDAFVFSDELARYCNLEYDFIGAPVRSWVKDWSLVHNKVGNGGFSLRKISSCIRVCQHKKDILALLPKDDSRKLLMWEDIFFSFCGNRSDIDFAIPGYGIASNFAVEADFYHFDYAYKRIRHGRYPFGCHAWSGVNYPFWQKIIEGLGYTLPLCNEINPAYYRWRALGERCLDRVLKYAQQDEFKKIRNEIGWQNMAGVSIWGWGVHGRRCYAFMQKMDVRVNIIYDMNVMVEAPISITEPTDMDISQDRNVIIVTPIKYEADIEQRLKSRGKLKGSNYFLWSEMLTEIRRYEKGKLYRSMGGGEHEQ